MENRTLTPRDFATIFPMRSKFGKFKFEFVAHSIMTILARTGNEWKRLSWNDYKSEREKDGDFTEDERHYFSLVVGDIMSPVDASNFSAEWRKIS